MRDEAKAPSEPIMERALSLVKRAESVLGGVRAMSTKLYGGKPSSECLPPGDMSVTALLDRLYNTLAEVDRELELQHQGMGYLNETGSQVPRAVAR
jgi:hypothetical protein